MRIDKARLKLLQIFAEGDGGGDAAPAGTSGVTAEDAAQPQTQADRLAALGVPPDKIRPKFRAKQAQPEQAAAAEPAADGAAQEEAAETAPAPARMTWDEIMADPEYNQHMQETVQQRVKKYKGASESMSKLQPLLEGLAAYYGVDASDLDALTERFAADDHYYEDKAVEMGVSPDVARRLTQAEQAQVRQRQQAAEDQQRQQFQQHIQRLQEQGDELKKIFPQFDLFHELENETFRRMTSPGVGLSVQDAYYAIHREEIQAAQAEVTARRTAERMSNAIQSGQRRPVEGTPAQAPSSSSPTSYRNMSREQREALKNRIRRGEIIRPGEF